MPAVTAHQLGAVFVLIGTILLWGYSWIVMKQVMAHAGPFDFAALRFLIGAAILFAALLLSGQPQRPPPVLPMVLIGLCQTAAFQGLEQLALVSGGAGHVAMLAFTGQSAEHRPRHRRRPRLGGGHGAEQAHVSTPRALSAQSHRLANAGRWHRAGDRGAGGAATFDRLNWAFIGGLAYSAVLASSLAWWLWSIVLQRLPTTVASVSSMGVPIVSVPLAWLILHEQPSAMELVGIVLVLLGLIAVSGVRFGNVRRL